MLEQRHLSSNIDMLQGFLDERFGVGRELPPVELAAAFPDVSRRHSKAHKILGGPRRAFLRVIILRAQRINSQFPILFYFSGPAVGVDTPSRHISPHVFRTAQNPFLPRHSRSPRLQRFPVENPVVALPSRIERAVSRGYLQL